MDKSLDDIIKEKKDARKKEGTSKRSNVGRRQGGRRIPKKIGLKPRRRIGERQLRNPTRESIRRGRPQGDFQGRPRKRFAQPLRVKLNVSIYLMT